MYMIGSFAWTCRVQSYLPVPPASFLLLYGEHPPFIAGTKYLSLSFVCSQHYDDGSFVVDFHEPPNPPFFSIVINTYMTKYVTA